MLSTRGKATSTSRRRNLSAKTCDQGTSRTELMQFTIDPAAEIACAVVALCWIVFGGIFVLGRSGAATEERKRAGKFSPGLLLQSLGYVVCFVLARTFFSPLFPMSQPAELASAALTILIAVASIWFCLAAVR